MLATNLAFWKQRKTRPVSLFRIRIFAYSVDGRLSQPFRSFLPQFSRAMQRELLLHTHLMRLDQMLPVFSLHTVSLKMLFKDYLEIAQCLVPDRRMA